MSIHFCILSQQPAPNFTPLMDSRLKAEQVCFLVTEQMQASYQGLKLALSSRGIRCDKIDLDKPMDLSAIQLAVEDALNNLGDVKQKKAVFLNATGGTKPISIGAYLAFYNADLPVFYVQGDFIHWLGDTPSGYEDIIDIDNKLRIKDYLILQGKKVLVEGENQTPPKYEDLTQKFLKLSIEHANDLSSLNYLAYKAKSQNQGVMSIDLKDKDLNRQGLQFVLDECESKGLLTVKGRRLTFTDEASRFFCNGGWLEHRIHSALKKINKDYPGRIQDVMRSVEFESNGSHHEMDVVALVDNNIIAIECKTKKDSAKEDDMRSQIHRLNTICNELGGQFAKGALVTAHEPRKADLDRIKAQSNRLIISGKSLQNVQSTLVRFLFA